MRKYFLLSAVALMAATSANATTDYAEVTARATIEVAGTLNCNDLDFGTIVVKQNNAISTVTHGDASTHAHVTGDILSVKGDRATECDNLDTYLSFPDSITLTFNENTMTAQLVSGSDWCDGSSILGTLNIPANVVAGEYTGSFTVTSTY